MDDSKRRVRGTVKWFNEAKGFGFLTPDDGGEDCFVHYSAIERQGFRTLTEGEVIEFEMVQGQKGPAAEHVVKVEDPDAPSPSTGDAAFMALAMVQGSIRLVELQPDGKYSFVDESSSVHRIVYIDHGALARKDAIAELEYLVNDPGTKEADLQDFFERHPNFILNDHYRHAHSQVVLEAEDWDPLVPDFVLEPVEQGGLCDLLELKLPATQIFVLKKNRARFSAAVFEAAAQLRTYSEFFDEARNRKAVQRRYGLQAFRPRMFVIIGRRGEVDPLTVRSMEGDVPGLQLSTYDQIIERAKARWSI